MRRQRQTNKTGRDKWTNVGRERYSLKDRQTDRHIYRQTDRLSNKIMQNILKDTQT